MKAVLHNSENPNEPLKIEETENPKPKENEVLVKVKATALNRADLLQRAGKYPPPKGASKILGLEIAGEVVEIGEKVTNHKVGDEVFGLIGGGGYAQFAIIDAQMAISKPKHFSFEEAAAIPEVFLTAFQTIFWTLLGNENTGTRNEELGVGNENENVGNQKSILIHAGASGVGSAAIQICKILGMKVFVTASKSKHEFCQNLGADIIIDYKNEDFAKVISEKTDDKGVNYIIDFIGKDYWKQNIDCIAVDGQLAVLAAMSGAKLENANLSKILIKRIQITGSTLRSRSLEYQRELTRQFSEFALPLFQNKTLKPIIDSIFDWSLAEYAHKHMEDNQNKGKIILSVSQDS
ncbi:NAD(P)H-quinone oxidoreductase [Bernardetia sp. ABR2-2B]|uniref:NAD(P)H-quinone oxidoreductase n=1 Tax=Bernardetia sp. ABR2-2B TaxID=3127472 RepID=UPI0030D187C9